MNKKTLLNIFFLVAINVIIKPFWLFGVDRVVQNRLGEEVFGVYFVLFNFSMIYQIILDFGLRQFNSTEIAKDESLIHTYFPNIVLGKLLLSFLFIAIAIPSFLALGYAWQDYGFILLLLLLNQILISYNYYLRSNFSGMHQFKLDAFASVLDKVLMIIFGSSLLYFNYFNVPLNITNFILIQTLAFGISTIILFLIVRNLAKPFSFDYNFKLIKETALKSLPFALSIFLMSIYLKMDAIMIERLLGDEGPQQAGIYAQSFRIIDALNMIGIFFANILLPTYARRISNKEHVGKLIAQACGFLAFIILPVALFMIYFRDDIILNLYVNGSAYSAKILAILTLSFLAYSSMHIFSSLLTAAKKLRILNYIFLFGILFNLVSNFIFIPKYKAVGAAWTTAISEVAVLISIIIVVVYFIKRNLLVQE